MNTEERTRARILNVLKTSKRPLSERVLIKKVKGSKNPAKLYEIDNALRSLSAEGKIKKDKSGWQLSLSDKGFVGEVTRLHKTFGFVRPTEKGSSDEEIFIPGKYMLGAIPGDIVLCENIPSRGELPEAQIKEILKYSSSSFSGTLLKEDGVYYIQPDTLCKDKLEIEGDVSADPGDKIICEISHRGSRHSEHRCTIAASFGSSESAKNCAMTTLYINEIETDFPLAVMDEARHIGNMSISDRDIYSRLDLRDKPIFTIDGADTKDIDDAISVERTESGYALGVHIADVSHYVKPGSALDNDAFVRGTSIYFADTVIPMLPKELSNGICSLNPKEDRLAFSCLMTLDNDGKLLSYKFSKSVIRSRVKGVYSEVNRIIEAGDYPDAELAEKYEGLLDEILLASELAQKLCENRRKRGAPDIESPEPKLVLDENGKCTDVQKRVSGKAEEMIEDFMLMANTSAAKTAKEKNIPFVYRVHESPSPEKAARFTEILDKLGIAHPDTEKLKAAHISKILNEVKDSDIYPIINSIALRSMAKAKYSHEPLGHYGLVLDDYAHFTSPIRRYPDLAIHRILTSLCYDKESPSQLKKKYSHFAYEAAANSSECELLAMKTERECDSHYIAEYMASKLGEVFEGTVSSVTAFGMYVELDNTAEGLVRIESIHPPCDFDGDFSLTADGKTLYRIGQRVKVKTVKAEVSSGNIDFELAG